MQKNAIFFVAGSHSQNCHGENMKNNSFLTNIVMEQVIVVNSDFGKLLLGLRYFNEFAYHQSH